MFDRERWLDFFFRSKNLAILMKLNPSLIYQYVKQSPLYVRHEKFGSTPNLDNIRLTHVSRQNINKKMKTLTNHRFTRFFK